MRGEGRLSRFADIAFEQQADVNIKIACKVNVKATRQGRGTLTIFCEPRGSVVLEERIREAATIKSGPHHFLNLTCGERGN